MKIRTKLLLFITVSVIVPIIIISSFSIYQARMTALENFETSSRKEITQIDNSFNLFFKAIADNVTFLADLPLVKDNSFSLSSFVNGLAALNRI